MISVKLLYLPSVLSFKFEAYFHRYQEKTPPEKSSPWGVRGKVRFRLGIGLGLESGWFFPRTIFITFFRKNTSCFHSCTAYGTHWVERKYCHETGYGSSPSQMFFNLGVKNFGIFTGKHLCWSLFSEVVGLKACNFIKKRL